MHAVRGTIGHDPTATAKAEGRDPYPTTTKQESREKFFAARHAAFNSASSATLPAEPTPPVPGFLVEWVTPAGQKRFCGKANGGISAESVVHLIEVLVRNGRASVFTVTRNQVNGCPNCGSVILCDGIECRR